MKKLIKLILIIPLSSFLLTVVLFAFLYKNLLHDVALKKFEQEETQLINREKNYLKNQIENIIEALNQIRIIGYALAENEMKSLLTLVIKNKPRLHDKGFFQRHYSKNMFFWTKHNEFKFPADITFKSVQVGDKKYLLIIHNNKKYLSVLTKENNETFGIAFSLDLIKNTIKENMFKFLDKINKDQLSYIAMGKITNYNPGKDGVFGKIIYMPEKLKFLIGKKLSINDPDIKGNYYRKKYFECIKNGQNCFVEYYFKNPNTLKEEKKISYFALFKPYNWTIVKGIYVSQIEDIINKNKQIIFRNVKNVFMATFIILVFITIVSFLITYTVGGFIVRRVIDEYETLKNNYEKAKKDLLKNVYYDSLTKLPNRYKLISDIKNFKSLILIDIDNFSSVNDVYGFDFGNEILNFVAECLQKNYKFVYRVSSDEFAVCLEKKVNELIILNILNMQCEYKGVKISFTVGASNLEDKLFETAETALKFALKDSKLKYLIYDEQMEHEQKEKLQKIQILHKIYENEDVIPYYHCIVDSNGNIIKYEALMRLRNDGKIYSPYQFMNILKESKLYTKFSQLMIKKVFEEAPKLDKPVSVNLSFEDLNNEITKKFIYNKLKTHSNIVFEILETEDIELIEPVIEFITNVKKYGAKIAIDDFGSGYSNFVNILSLNPDYIKIDSSLVKNYEEEKYIEIIKLINEFAKKFGIKTVAEFVSDEKKYKILKNLGIDEFQGYYFCEPKPLNELI